MPVQYLEIVTDGMDATCAVLDSHKSLHAIHATYFAGKDTRD